MRISVFGLGYVGIVTVACLGEAGHSVTGVDVQEEKVSAMAKGNSPIVEPGIPELLAEAHGAGRLHATLDSRDAIRQSDYSIVCVGTPSSSGGLPDLEHVWNVGREIAAAIREKEIPHVVILRSTVLPGTTAQWAENFFADLLSEGRVRLYFYPEFLRESSAIEDFKNPGLSVIGSRSEGESIDDLAFLWKKKPRVVDWKTAELLKYACNAWHATKIVFANEIGRLGRSQGVDSRTVMELLCEDLALNISSYYLKPGNSFGGSCLPKDILAISQFGRRAGLFLPLLENLKESNHKHFEALAQQVARTGKREAIILGLTFKNNTDDLRESAMVALAQLLLGQGYTVRVFDPNLKLGRLTGQNKSHIECRMPHLASVLYTKLEDAMGNGGLVIAAQKVAAVEEIACWLKPEHQILDVNGWPQLKDLPCPYEGFCW